MRLPHLSFKMKSSQACLSSRHPPYWYLNAQNAPLLAQYFSPTSTANGVQNSSIRIQSPPLPAGIILNTGLAPWNMAPRLKCPKCGYVWIFRGHSRRPTCPNCFAKVPLKRNRTNELPNRFREGAFEIRKDRIRGDIPRLKCPIHGQWGGYLS